MPQTAVPERAPAGARSAPSDGRAASSEPWSGQVGDSLLVSRNRCFEPLAERRANHAQALDDQACARGQAHELIVYAQLGELLLATANQDESCDVASVRLQNHRLEAFDHSVLLQTPVVLERFVEA